MGKEVRSFCPSCNVDRKFKLLIDVYQEIRTAIHVLSACMTCNKGNWIEFDRKDFDKKKKEIAEERLGR